MNTSSWILLVEDTREVASMLRRLIRARHPTMRVKIVDSEGAARQAISREPTSPSALLLDGHLADGVSGVDVFVALRGDGVVTRCAFWTSDSAFVRQMLAKYHQNESPPVFPKTEIESVLGWLGGQDEAIGA